MHKKSLSFYRQAGGTIQYKKSPAFPVLWGVISDFGERFQNYSCLLLDIDQSIECLTKFTWPWLYIPECVFSVEYVVNPFEIFKP